MAHKILILLGPNLNLLGRREPDIYGHETMQDIENMCRDKGNSLDIETELKQSNHEGELVTWIQGALDDTDAIIINAAAYTHTSLAIHDALKMFEGPILEVHHSDPQTREGFRKFSYIEPLATHIIKGKGAKGYSEALDALSTLLKP